MTKWSRATGVGYQTVRRWVHGNTPVPPMAIAHLKLLELLVKKGHPLPPEYTD